MRLRVLAHDTTDADPPEPFIDVGAAMASAQARFGPAPADWSPVTLKAYDLVRVAETDPEPDIRGLDGHVVGLVSPDQAAVLLHALETVWCVDPAHLIPSGGTLPLDQRPDPRVRIRVSRDGDLI